MIRKAVFIGLLFATCSLLQGQNPVVFPLCYEGTPKLLEKNKVAKMLMLHSYGSDSPFLTVHTLIDLVSELHYATAGLALSTQSMEQEEHTVTLRNALERIDNLLSETLYNFTNDLDRYEPLRKLLTHLKETKAYIDLNLGELVKKSQTYRRASRQQKRFLATTTVAFFASKKILTGAIYGICGVVASLAIWRWLTSKERKLCHKMSGSRLDWAHAIGLRRKVLKVPVPGSRGGLCYRAKIALEQARADGIPDAVRTRRRNDLQDLFKFANNRQKKGTLGDTGIKISDLAAGKWDPDNWH